MSQGGAELLRLLGGGTPSVSAVSRVRPAGAEAPGTGFGEMLEQARRGELRSGLPVSVSNDAGITLSGDELQALSVAADRAEAQGVRRAVVYMGGRALLLDVQTRTIEGIAQAKDGVIAGIDGVIRMDADSPGTPDQGAAPQVLRVPAGVPGAHPSLASLLGDRASR